MAINDAFHRINAVASELRISHTTAVGKKDFISNPGRGLVLYCPSYMLLARALDRLQRSRSVTLVRLYESRARQLSSYVPPCAEGAIAFGTDD